MLTGKICGDYFRSAHIGKGMNIERVLKLLRAYFQNPKWLNGRKLPSLASDLATVSILGSMEIDRMKDAFLNDDGIDGEWAAGSEMEI